MELLKEKSPTHDELNRAKEIVDLLPTMQLYTAWKSFASSFPGLCPANNVDCVDRIGRCGTCHFYKVPKVGERNLNLLPEN